MARLTKVDKRFSVAKLADKSLIKLKMYEAELSVREEKRIVLVAYEEEMVNNDK